MILEANSDGVYLLSWTARFGFATVNKDEFDALSKSMIDLSEKFVRASQVAVLKSLQEGQASLSDQMTQFSRQLQILAIQPNKSCSLVARLEGQTSLINNMTERKLLAYPVVTSLEPAHTTNTGKLKLRILTREKPS